MKRIVISSILSIAMFSSMGAFAEENKDILIRQAVVCRTSGFVLTREFSSKEIQELREKYENTTGKTDKVKTSGSMDVGIGASGHVSTTGWGAEMHGNCDLHWRGEKEANATYVKTEMRRIDIDTAYMMGNWKLLFHLTLRSAERGRVFHWTGEQPSVRLTGLGINRPVPFDGRSPLADVRFNRPLVLDFELPCDDEVLFKTLAKHQDSLENDLSVELPAGFPLADEENKPVADSMVVGDDWDITAPATISLTFGPAESYSPWYARPQTADGKKMPVTLRMALAAIQRDIEQEPTLPDNVFEFDEANGLRSVCGVPFGRISVFQEGAIAPVRVVPLLRINEMYHFAVPADLLEKPLSRASNIEFVGRCIDKIEDIPLETLARWSPFERKALLTVLDSAVAENPSDKSAGRAASWLRLADEKATVRLQGATALETLEKGTKGKDCEILYQLHADGRLAGASAEQANHWRLKAAKFGNVKAQFDEGRSCTKDCKFDDAFSWMQKAAEQEHAEAQRVLGDFYLNGRGCKRSESKAAKWYGKSTTPEAKASLGRLYVRGEGVRQKEHYGLCLIADAATNGNPYAQAQLGLRFKYGEANPTRNVLLDTTESMDVVLNPYPVFSALSSIISWADELASAKEAVKWFRKSASQNNSYGLARLGVCYRDGYGVKKNPAKAARLFKKAIKYDTEYWGEYQRLLGKLYRDGEGVSKDVERAARLFQEAAKMGDSEGQYCLALCYLNGTGVAKDVAEGRKWLKEASKNGHEKAKTKLSSLSKKSP